MSRRRRQPSRCSPVSRMGVRRPARPLRRPAPLPVACFEHTSPASFRRRHRSQLAAPAARLVAAGVPLLSSSLQVRLGPDSGPTTQDATGGASQTGALSPGPSQGTRSSRQSPASGNSGQSAGQQAGTGTMSPQKPAQSGGKQGSGQGQQGDANTNDQSQAQQSGQQPDNSNSVLPSQAPSGSRTDPPSSQAQPGQPPVQSSTQPDGNTRTNPFGTDPAAPRLKSGPATPANGAKSTGPGRPSSSSRQLHGSAGTRKGGASGGADNSADPRPYERSGTSLSSSPNGPRTGKSGGKSSSPTRITTIQVAGKPTTGSGGGQGPDLVRVIPSGTVSGEALQGPGGGSTSVQGYVPEQSIALSPDEQALIRSYFSSGSSS